MATRLLVLVASVSRVNVGVASADEGPRVHVRGTSRIDAHIGNGHGKAVLSGAVADDAGRPVPHASVVVSIAHESNVATGNVALSSAAPEACPAGGIRPGLDSAERILLVTDDSGAFCVRFALPVARYVAHLEARPTKLLEATALGLSFDLALKSVTLRFEPVPTIVSLDDETTTLGVLVSSEDDDRLSAGADLTLQLSNESGTALAEAVTTADGRAQFVVPSVRLGPPGDGELRVVFPGTRAAGGSSRYQWIERRTRIRTRITAIGAAAGGKLPVASPEDGIPLDVIAKADCADRGCQVAPTGIIEVHVGNVLVGAAPLSRGAAHVTATFVAEGTGDVELRVTYRPDAPWFQPTDEALLVQPIGSRRPWGKLAISLTGIGVLGWFIWPRIPSRRRPELPVRMLRPQETIAHGVPEGAAHDGWTGRVVDAHDGLPIMGAALRVERPGFERADILGETVSAANGAFALAPMKPKPGDQLVIESTMHSTLTRPLPPFGHLEVAMVHRKRALLGRLVAWAQARGGRFDAKPEPTPAQIRHAAGSDSPVGGWADAVERAIYGGSVIDAHAQSAIDRLNPDARDAGPAEKADPPDLPTAARAGRDQDRPA